MTEKDDYRNNNHPTVDGGGKVKFESGSKWSHFNSNVQYAAFCKKYSSILMTKETARVLQDSSRKRFVSRTSSLR